MYLNSIPNALDELSTTTGGAYGCALGDLFCLNSIHDANEGGPKVYRWVENSSGASWPIGSIIIQNDASGAAKGLLAVGNVLYPGVRVLGVVTAQSAAWATANRGWLQCYGPCTIQKGASTIVVGSAIVTEDTATTANDGQMQTMAAGEEHGVFGFATAGSTAAAGTLVAAFLKCI